MNKVFIVYFIVLNITVVLGNKQNNTDDEYKNELQKIFNILFVADISVNDTNALEKLRVHISTKLESVKMEIHEPNELLDEIESAVEELKEIKSPEDLDKLKKIRLKFKGVMDKISKGGIVVVKAIAELFNELFKNYMREMFDLHL